MANIITLISINTLKNFYPFDDNIEDKYLLSNIKKAQDFYIKPILGDVRMTDLLTKISGNTLTNDDKTFINEYLEPILAYEVMSEVIYTTAYKIKNQGLNDSTEANQYRFSEAVKVSEKYHNDSQHYLQMLRDYMCDENIQVGEDYIFESPIYLGDGYNKHRNDNAYANYHGQTNIKLRRYDI